MGDVTKHSLDRARKKTQRERLARAWSLGEGLVPLYCHGNARMESSEAVIWSLLCHATRVSRRAYRGTPRSGYATMSLGADMAVDEITAWQRVAAYLRGELDSAPVSEQTPPAPSAAEISACEVTLDIYHAEALRGLGDWRRLRVAVYAQAAGMPPRKVHGLTGIDRNRLRHARDRAVNDMLIGWHRCASGRSMVG